MDNTNQLTASEISYGLNNSPLTILLVEDDDALQEGINDLLRYGDLFSDYPVDVITADNGVDAIENIKAVTPHLIISDIMMPQMDGYELLDTIRKKDKWINIPFIFLTAKGKDQDIRLGQYKGVEKYITKPFEPNVFLDSVKAQLRLAILRLIKQRKNFDELKKIILQRVNHEFRTPLTYVTAYYEMLRESINSSSPSNIEDYLRGIRSGCERLINLVQDLVDVTDIRTGAVEEAFSTSADYITDIDAIIASATERNRAIIVDSQAELHVHVDPNLPSIWGVSKYLVDIFSHLIENAAKFAHHKRLENRLGHIEIRVFKNEDGDIQADILDNGIGVPANKFDQIFDLFYQHNREHWEQQGSGAGLFIVKGLALLHHAQLNLDSRVDRGSKFTISFPPAEKTLELIKESKKNKKLKAHVLVVEDDHHLLIGLKELLLINSNWPYSLEVTMAVDGVDGLNKLAEKTPNLIITDIMMPNMDGYEFLDKVRATPEYLDIPVIYLSAKGEQRDKDKGSQLAVDRYVTKPYDSEDLLSHVETMLDRYFQRRQVENIGFEGFKDSIILALEPGFKIPLENVNNMTKFLSDAESTLKEAENSDALRHSLQNIQIDSAIIADHVEDFIMNAEIATGETASVFHNRAYLSRDLGAILQEAQIIWEQKQPSHKRMFHHKLTHQHRPVLIDHETLQRAFTRLIGIIFESSYRRDGYDIWIETTEQGDQIVIKLWHTGRTFDKSTAEQITQRLKLSDITNDNDFDRLTFGSRLDIVKGVLGVHNGTFEFQSGINQKPATDYFICTLPCASDEDIKANEIFPDPF